MKDVRLRPHVYFEALKWPYTGLWSNMTKLLKTRLTKNRNARPRFKRQLKALKGRKGRKAIKAYLKHLINIEASE
tara:strand:+ start:490 stop:714 length:225 start_codon:yes stop_codon:yes gene_type:complete